jgi:hypothetical protein
MTVRASVLQKQTAVGYYVRKFGNTVHVWHGFGTSRSWGSTKDTATADLTFVAVCTKFHIDPYAKNVETSYM